MPFKFWKPRSVDRILLEKKADPWQHFYCERNEPSSQLGTPRSAPLQLGFDNPLFDRLGLEGVVVVVVEMEISGPSSSSMVVPSNVFVFNFGLPRSRSDGDVDVDVEMAMEDAKVCDGGCSLEEGH
jgi:hypothetical protein